MSERILLLVEDNADDEALTVRALRKLGSTQQIVVVRDGPEALDYLFAHGAYSQRNPQELPLVVLLDIKLPKLTGLEVLRELRSNVLTQSMPIVVFTSSQEQQDVAAAYHLGANSYIHKPMEARAFVETVCQTGIYWLTYNQPVPASH